MANNESDWVDEDWVDEEIPTEPIRANGLTGISLPTLPDVLRSGAKFAGGIASAIMHPTQIGEGIFKLGAGDKETVNAFKQMLSDKYGGWDEVQNTFKTDPVGFAADISTLLGGGAGLAGKIGTLAKTSKLDTLINVLSKGSEITNPVSVITKPVSSALNVGTKPFSKAVRPDITETAQKYGIELPASAQSTSRIVALQEASAAKGFGGTNIMNRVTKSMEDMVKKADEFTSSIDSAKDSTDIGMQLNKGLTDTKKIFRTVKDDLYKQADLSEIKVPVDTNEAITKIEEIISTRNQSLLPKSSVSMYEKILDGLVKENKNGIVIKRVTPEQIKQTIQDLNSKIDWNGLPISRAEQSNLKAIASALENGLDNTLIKTHPELEKAITTANTYYKTGITKINSAWGKKISALASKGQYDKIADAVLNSNTSINDIPKIFETVGVEGKKALQYNIVNGIIQDAKTSISYAKDPFTKFKPQAISNAIGKYSPEKLKTILTPEQYQFLLDFEKLTRGQGNLDNIINGSQTAFLSMANIKAAVGKGLWNKWLGSPKGQKWLLQGYDVKPAFKSGAKRALYTYQAKELVGDK